MDPRLESLVEEFLPVGSNLKHQRSAEKEMFIAKTSSHATEIKQVPTQKDNTQQRYYSLFITKTAISSITTLLHVQSSAFLTI